MPTQPNPIRLYRFALQLHEGAEDTYTLALIPAQSPEVAFDRGCALMPTDSASLARSYWRRMEEEPEGDPATACFTTHEIEQMGDAVRYACDALEDIHNILGGFRL